jgi:hypothetical protein
MVGVSPTIFILNNFLSFVYIIIEEKMATNLTSLLIPEEVIMNKIFFIRGQKVMLDRDLGELYGLETKRLKGQVKRNISRFPTKYMFELTEKEFESLRSQIATSKTGRGGTRYLPIVFYRTRNFTIVKRVKE